MKQGGLAVKKKKRFMVTTDSNHNKEPAANNLLAREFNPDAMNRSGQPLSRISGQCADRAIFQQPKAGMVNG